ncbi:MAG: UMP kinase [Nanoarchaeota archaeon]|nr:UMP kinase [Nanoarchaeota archaeon]MBU1030697.1 UMP kinase [Nanoarchaeota archaeon]MBU1849357.1 UMP kinase [Nanoarchaeota archaeon]
MKKETIILSLGGSLIFPEEIDAEYLKEFKKLIEKYIKEGFRFVIITGGGKICRKYQSAARDISKISDLETDWLGISVTKMNAQFVKSLFGDLAHPTIIDNPTKKIAFEEKILIGCGWKPGCSSDKDAVLLAKNLGIKKVINLTNIEYVYNKDPRQFEDAKKIEKISWKDFRRIVGDKWDPGLNVPFDPVASKLSERLGLTVIIANGKNLNNLQKIFDNKKFTGTIIS